MSHRRSRPQKRYHPRYVTTITAAQLTSPASLDSGERPTQAGPAVTRPVSSSRSAGATHNTMEGIRSMSMRSVSLGASIYPLGYTVEHGAHCDQLIHPTTHPYPSPFHARP